MAVLITLYSHCTFSLLPLPALFTPPPDAVALVDSFGFLDSQLKSTIGRFDGQVYEAIYEEARRNPLNQTEGGEMVGWQKVEALKQTADNRQAWSLEQTADVHALVNVLVRSCACVYCVFVGV